MLKYENWSKRLKIGTSEKVRNKSMALKIPHSKIKWVGIFFQSDSVAIKSSNSAYLTEIAEEFLFLNDKNKGL